MKKEEIRNIVLSNNVMFRVVTREGGFNALKWFKTLDIDTGNYNAEVYEMNSSIYCYYGIIDGKFCIEKRSGIDEGYIQIIDMVDNEIIHPNLMYKFYDHESDIKIGGYLLGTIESKYTFIAKVPTFGMPEFYQHCEYKLEDLID